MLRAALATEYPFARFGVYGAFWMEPSPEVMTRIFLAWLLRTKGTNARRSRSCEVMLKFTSFCKSSTILYITYISLGISTLANAWGCLNVVQGAIEHTIRQKSSGRCIARRRCWWDCPVLLGAACSLPRRQSWCYRRSWHPSRVVSDGRLGVLVSVSGDQENQQYFGQ